jgi:hypothetical protein
MEEMGWEREVETGLFQSKRAGAGRSRKAQPGHHKELRCHFGQEHFVNTGPSTLCSISNS